MRQYKRNREGSMFFFTVVTHQRRSFLTSPLARQCLRQAIQHVRRNHPFDITAIVLLPDHLHAIWQLPHGDNNYPTRWRLIKRQFTLLWLKQHGQEGGINDSRSKKGERGLWQRRYYEHTIRDEVDLERCMNYLHVNPLKHGLVERVIDYPWSSFHRYVKLGYYASNWGSANEWYGDEFQHAE